MNIVCILSTNHPNPPPSLKQPAKHLFLSKNENLWTNAYVVFRGVGARVPPRGSSQQIDASRHRQAGVTLAAGRACPTLSVIGATIAPISRRRSSPPSSDEYFPVAAGGGRRQCHHGAAAEADVRSGIPGCCLIGSLLAHSSLDCWLTDCTAGRLRSL